MVPCKVGNMAIAESEDYAFVASAPVVLYSVIIANESTTVAAKAGVYNGAVATAYMDFAVPAGGTVVWSGCVALPKGLAVACESGAVRATVMYV